jgi:poly(3-hydroxybutyrate) depolymerase
MKRSSLLKLVLITLLFLVPIFNIEAEIEGIKSVQRELNNNSNMKFWILTPKNIPKEGYGLVVALAGGDGDGGKNVPFWENVIRRSLDDRYIVVLPVAHKWDKDQEITWPTDKHKDIVKGMQFTTEEFVFGLVNEVVKENKINANNVWLHGVSSGGPAVYAISLSHPACFKGYYVLSSVFKIDQLPSLSLAKGKKYYIQHGREDKVCPFWMAKKAAFQLKENGAVTELDLFQGPHGYPFKEGHPDWESIKAAFVWLEK